MIRCQAAQHSPMTTPMPQDEDASTYISGSIAWQGKMEHDPPMVDRIDLHHIVQSLTEWGA